MLFGCLDKNFLHNVILVIGISIIIDVVAVHVVCLFLFPQGDNYFYKSTFFLGVTISCSEYILESRYFMFDIRKLSLILISMCWMQMRHCWDKSLLLLFVLLFFHLMKLSRKGILSLDSISEVNYWDGRNLIVEVHDWLIVKSNINTAFQKSQMTIQIWGNSVL